MIWPPIKAAVEATFNAANGATKLTSEMPELVASERKEAVEAINEDLRKILTFINEERIVSFEQISRERTAMLQQLDEGRRAATGELHEIATSERAAFCRVIEQTGLRIVDKAASRTLTARRGRPWIFIQGRIALFSSLSGAFSFRRSSLVSG